MHFFSLENIEKKHVLKKTSVLNVFFVLNVLNVFFSKKNNFLPTLIELGETKDHAIVDQLFLL